MNREISIENPFGLKPAQPMKTIELCKATDKELRQHYYQARKLRQEFDEIRQTVYMTQGVFNYDPVMAEYRSWLRNEHNTKYICIEE